VVVVMPLHVPVGAGVTNDGVLGPVEQPARHASAKIGRSERIVRSIPRSTREAFGKSRVLVKGVRRATMTQGVPMGVSCGKRRSKRASTAKVPPVASALLVWRTQDK
jgi:hypothetical protein